jgi:multidrug resistance efflux pump
VLLVGNSNNGGKIRYALNEIDKDSYQLTQDHLQEKLAQVEKEMPSLNSTLSNLENLITKSLEKAANLNKIWDSSGLEQKQNMCRILFPGGIFYDAKKHRFLTKRENAFLALTRSLSSVYTENKNGTSQELLEKSLSVAVNFPFSNLLSAIDAILSI